MLSRLNFLNMRSDGRLAQNVAAKLRESRCDE